MVCEHDYCEECIKLMMQGTNVKLTCKHENPGTKKVCGKLLDNEVLHNVDHEIFKKYCEKLNRASIGGSKKT